MPRLKHSFLRIYWVAAALAAGAIYLSFVVAPRVADWKLTLAGLGAVLSFVYFVQKQRLEELKLFKELFQSFNARYDEMNEDLQELLDQEEGSPFSEPHQNLLVDYFNLCAEEYLFYRLGYIDPCVWSAWQNGMRAIVRDARVRAFWEREAASDSYYGLRIPP